ncbi:hypothetical protein J437_LFUL004165 [Ladona fulva]|uniref:Reverse transcriptase n=1 Tax=Ladona fulva TaxID=123851 RepID=A0A8K0K0Z0_LADFU|nr:hypothetical protein J437_LFUL004165 [Ladona fulva]
MLVRQRPCGPEPGEPQGRYRNTVDYDGSGMTTTTASTYSPSSEILVIPTNQRHQALHLIRRTIEEGWRRSLVAKPDQGKVYHAASSHFLRDGRHTRFCDWRFIHRAQLNLLPLNAARHGVARGDMRCTRCGTAAETLPHVLNHCAPHSAAWTECHNEIQRILVESLPNEWNIRVDRRIPGVASLFDRISWHPRDPVVRFTLWMSRYRSTTNRTPSTPPAQLNEQSMRKLPSVPGAAPNGSPSGRPSGRGPRDVRQKERRPPPPPPHPGPKDAAAPTEDGLRGHQMVAGHLRGAHHRGAAIPDSNIGVQSGWGASGRPPGETSRRGNLRLEFDKSHCQDTLYLTLPVRTLDFV